MLLLVTANTRRSSDRGNKGGGDADLDHRGEPSSSHSCVPQSSSL